MKRCTRCYAFLPVLIAVLLLTLLSGCLKRPGPSPSFDEADLSDPEGIYRQIVTRSEASRTLQAAANLRLRSEDRKAGLDTMIACDRQGRMRFEVLDLLNHVAFLAVFGPQGFLTYTPAENEYLQGPENSEQIREMLGIPLRAEELTALALGDPFFLPLSDPTVRISVDQNALLLDVESSGPGPRYLVWLDENKRPAKMFVIRPYGGGRAIGDLHVEYGRYRTVEGVSFPHRIHVTATGVGRELRVDYDKVLLNVSLDDDLFQFVPPEGATRSTGWNR
jgi:hypothetical protein